jgi:hypothetical protein
MNVAPKMPDEQVPASKPRSVAVRSVVVLSLLAFLSYSFAASVLRYCRWLGEASLDDSDLQTSIAPAPVRDGPH